MYRYYLGRSPAYLISDLDLLKQITVKEFSKFTNRPLGVSSSGYLSLLIVQDVRGCQNYKRVGCCRCHGSFSGDCVDHCGSLWVVLASSLF